MKQCQCNNCRAFGGIVARKAAPRPTVAQRLLARLRAEGFDLPEGSTLERFRVGRHQRSASAWAWGGAGNVTASRVGSEFTMKECLAAREWEIFVSSWGDKEIIPKEPKEPKEKKP